MRVEVWVDSGIALAAALIASSGFWTYFQKRDKAKDATTRLLLGLAYGQIMTLGMTFIERGWVTKDEFEEFQKYLYRPYKELGGNGVAERVMTEVSGLPLMSHSRYTEVIDARRGNKESTNEQRCSHCGQATPA